MVVSIIKEVARDVLACAKNDEKVGGSYRSVPVCPAIATFAECACVQAAWAVGPGAGAIDQVYACSGSLNGEAVLVFVRALCAVSQEELNPAQPTDIPRYDWHALI